MKMFSETKLPYVEILLDALCSWVKEHPDEYLSDNEAFDLIDDLCGKENSVNFEVRSGCSRIVFTHSSWDFVLKLTYYDYEGEDVCLREYQYFLQAKEYDIQNILLPISDFADCGLPNGHLYIQPKISIQHSRLEYSDAFSALLRTNYESLDDGVVDDINDAVYCSRLPREWLAYAIKCFSKEFMERFAQWTCKLKVNDLHGSNVGFLNERPIILDYAGFYYNS